jgi:phosphate uptake regulator
MLKELMSLFKADDAVTRMGDDFVHMLELSHDLTVRAGLVFFETPGEVVKREEISKADVAINKLERHIRKQVVAHLVLSSNPKDVSFCLLLMSLVKDVERLGDYATNVAEVHHEGGGPLFDDEYAADLRAIRTDVEATYAALSQVFSTSDRERALELIRKGRVVASHCDELIFRVAASEHDAATTTTLVLGARYYKRIQAHLLNVLSGVVMPVHKIDYFDEKALFPDEDD